VGNAGLCYDYLSSLLFVAIPQTANCRMLAGTYQNAALSQPVIALE
jgi:hypothetical protein